MTSFVTFFSSSALRFRRFEMSEDQGIIRDDPNRKDGDFTLVSSDGWRFKVSSEKAVPGQVRKEYCQCAYNISVFRDGPCDLESPKCVAFPEDGIETKSVLYWFFALLALSQATARS